MDLKQMGTINIVDENNLPSNEILDMAKKLALDLAHQHQWTDVSIGKICIAQGLVNSTKKVHFFSIFAPQKS